MKAEEGPPRKRSRSTSIDGCTVPSHPQSERLRSPDLWFEDGNIIISAGNTLFKVHQSILSLHSSVFREVCVSLPVNKSHNGSCLGPPLVIARITDGCVKMTNLLRTFYDRTFYHISNEMGLDVLASLLSMSTAFKVPRLRADIVAHLGRYFPSKFRDFETIPFDRLDSGSDFLLAAAAMTGFARIMQGLILLPAALYICACQPAHLIVAAKSEVGDKFGDDDFRKIWIGRERLVAELRNLYKATFSQDALIAKTDAVCKDKDRCGGIKPSLTDRISWHTAGPSDLARCPWATSASVKQLLCTECVQMIDESMQKGREKIWAGLPGCFGLPDWETLELSTTGTIDYDYVHVPEVRCCALAMT